MRLSWFPSPSSLSSSLSSFRFDHVHTPLGSFATAATTCVAYLIVIAVLKLVWGTKGQPKRQPMDLRKLVIVYNFVMSFLSGVLFLVLVTELYQTWSRTSGFDLFCDPRGRNVKGLLIWCYYINYIFKFVELMDTIFLCLRQKETPFIHVYHHAITLMLCWTQLTVLISINLFVHVFLYSYYALYELRVDIWWKRHLTSVQILQFCIALLASLGAMGLRVMWEWTPTTFRLGAPCHGNWSGSYFGLAVIVSYLYLFIRLYNQKYLADEQAKLKAKNASVNGKSLESSSSSSSASSSAAVSTRSMLTATAVATALALPVLSCAEDAFHISRSAWLSHPYHVADRRRWEILELEHVRSEAMKGGAGGASMNNNDKDVSSYDTIDVQHASTLKKRFVGRNPDLRL